MKHYEITFVKKAKVEFESLDKSIRNRISAYLKDKVAQDPHSYGKNLSGNLNKYRRYRVGDYRIICEIKKQELIVFIVRIGHRKEVYD
ncbi:MAG TPA: type II toxin-antitoxin system RelE/ParE family toxin [Rickettsiales bacterium]|nr:type II toxin-antitoxin system RelE/ParE family toxin [Rickettsiales bacterium]